MRILLLDIETAPNTAMVWGLWKQNINLDFLVQSGYILCWAAKWLGAAKVEFCGLNTHTPRAMLARVHRLLSEAECVVHFYGSKFDIPTLNKEFLLYGLLPPAPYTQLDLLQVVRKTFKFPSNKLDYVAKALGLEGKLKHRGADLWIGCMAEDPACWREMREYNIRDVRVLEEVYKKLLPWITNHPHMGLHGGRPSACPNCASDKLESRGFAYTKLSSYRRYRCVDCGTWTRDSKRVAGASLRQVIG